MKTKKQTISKKSILDNFLKNKKKYTQSETWTWVHYLVKDIFEYLWFSPTSEFRQKDNMTYVRENHKSKETNSRADFILNYKWTKIVVEVEKNWFIEKNKKWEWFEQIKRYLELEQTPFWILTDWEKWYLYNKWYEDNIQYYTLEKILDEWEEIFETTFATKEYYIEQLKNKNSIIKFNTDKQKNIKLFHKKLILLAEKLKLDFLNIPIFKGKTEKEIIQTVYAFIIQFILIKIIQDTRNITLINKEEIINPLSNKNYEELRKNVFKQIKWLWDFYKSYEYEQKSLLKDLEKNYEINNNFKTIQWFLDLYDFIFSFNFKNLEEDIFGAIYENYLKELYKDDNTKKWQVFTPPEIVDFMLEEIWYTQKHIEEIILHYVNKNWIEKLEKELKKNKEKVEFNLLWLSVIDPTCWSWTFLYKAAYTIVKAIYNLKRNKKILFSEEKYYGILSENLIINNIVWFDIEAFPLYLAEMNILLTLLWFNIDKDWNILNKIDKPINIFSTKDTIAEFVNINDNIMDVLSKLDNIWWAKELELFTITKKRFPNEIFKIQIDILNWQIYQIIDKFLVNKIINEIDNKKLLKYRKKINNIKELDKYINIMNDKTLKAIYINKKYEIKRTQKKLNNIVDKFLVNRIINVIDNKYLKENIDNFQSIKVLKSYINEKNDKELKEKFNKIMKNNKKEIDYIRTKFDYVIGNPPYIAYNSIPKEIRENWKKNWLEMSNVFWINLHSIPWHQKKSPPKPNLYSYFWALAYFLAKENWKVSYIVPEWFVAYDCNTYYLTHKVNLQNLYFFNTKVFVDRWLNWKIDVATSAIIFKYTKTDKQNPLKLWSYVWKNNDIDNILSYMKNPNNWKEISKDLLKEYISTWFSILKQDNKILELLKIYKQNNQDIEIYYNHELAEKEFWSKFYFDIWYDINESNLYDIPKWEENNYYRYFLWKWKYISELSDKWRPKDKSKIWLLKANQWYNLLDSKYKIVWNKTIWFWNSRCFYFENKDIIWARNNFNWIWSSDKNEILYLFNLLNSSTSWKILDFYNKKPGEIRDYWVFLYTIKEQIRVPNINSKYKKQLKQKLIENTQNIIDFLQNNTDLTYRDILETQLATSLLAWEEEILWLKEEYSYLNIDLNIIDSDILDNKLDENIIEQIKDKNSIEKLENERDLLTYCLYFWKENPEIDDYIDLTKIKIDNILDSNDLILQNKYVKVVEGIEDNECNNKKEKKANLDNTNKNNLPDS